MNDLFLKRFSAVMLCVCLASCLCSCDRDSSGDAAPSEPDEVREIPVEEPVFVPETTAEAEEEAGDDDDDDDDDDDVLE